MTNELGLSNRIYAQYKDKQKAVDWFNINRIVAEELASNAKQVRECLDLDKAFGESLRIISRIVVTPRVKKEQLINASIVADTHGTPLDHNLQTVSEWSTFTDADLSDEVLRLIIRSKIIKNNTNVTHDDLLSAFDYLLPKAKVFRLIDYHDMSFSIEFIGQILPIEYWLLNIEDFVPTPQCVIFRGFIKLFGMIEFVKDADYQFANEKLEFLK